MILDVLTSVTSTTPYSLSDLNNMLTVANGMRSASPSFLSLVEMTPGMIESASREYPYMGSFTGFSRLMVLFGELLLYGLCDSSLRLRSAPTIPQFPWSTLCTIGPRHEHLQKFYARAFISDQDTLACSLRLPRFSSRNTPKDLGRSTNAQHGVENIHR
jgi:hypothetical protein